MFQAFIWMFKVKDFKKHVLYMFLLGLISYIIALILTIFPIPGIGGIIAKVPAAILFCLPALFITGYFWNLTEEVINRDWDLMLNNIYDGTVKEYYEITLPELSITKNAWRGFASLVAMTLIWIPFGLIAWIGFTSHSYESLSPDAMFIIPIFFGFFFPALMWNYANTNSIFGVWNIRKAIYLMGNYPLKYILNTIIFVIVALINSLIDTLVGTFLQTAVTNQDILGLVLGGVVVFLSIIKYLYFIFVYAYLLGTIAPPSEA